MADQYLSEIRVFSFGFPPRGWALCNGQTLSIQQNQALFSLLGTTYGGDGRVTFALPNLQARVPMHQGNGHVLGERAGETSHTLTTAEMPNHTHLVTASAASASTANPGVPAGVGNVYASSGSLVALNAASLNAAGGSQAHNNMMPYLAVSFCIAITGIFPSRN